MSKHDSDRFSLATILVPKVAIAPSMVLAGALLLSTPGFSQKARRAPPRWPAPLPEVFVVDDELGPDVDFQNLQLAVDSVFPGDVLLVRTGTYDVGSTLRITKGLTLQADEAAVIDFAQDPKPQILIEGVPRHENVILRGFRSSGATSGSADYAAARLVASDCRGTVWVEDCDFLTDRASAPALHVRECSSVVVVRCNLLGTRGIYPGDRGQPLFLENSAVHLYASSAIAGLCAHSGALLDNSFLFAAGSEITGGRDGCGCSTFGAGGGPGLNLKNGSSAVLRDTTLTGGPGGSAYTCVSTPMGPPSRVDRTSTLSLLPGSRLGYEATSPRREGERRRLTFQGPPGHEVYLVDARASVPVFDVTLAGSILVPPALISQATLLGAIPSSGELVCAVPIEGLASPADAASFFSQAFFVDPNTSAMEAGGASAWMALDASIDTSFVDCNRNGLHDPLDVSGFLSIDCNLNGVPDSCDIEDGTSEDCNLNRVPDECETARFLAAFDLESLGLEDLTISDMDATDEYVVVGASGFNDGAGAAFVFGYGEAGNLTLEAILEPSEPSPVRFGRGVDAQGGTIAIAEFGDAYVFERDSLGRWSEQARIQGLSVPDSAAFGADVAIDDDTLVVADSRASVGGVLSGAAFVFDRQGGVWAHQATLEGSKAIFTFVFPEVHVALNDGVALVGTESTQANKQGTVHVYLRNEQGTPADSNDDTWVEVQELTDDDALFEYASFSSSLGIRSQDDTLFVGSAQHAINGIFAGGVFVFERDDRGTPGSPLDDQWVQTQVLTPSDAEEQDRFGESLSVDAEVLLVGTGNIYFTNGPFNPGAYIFRQDYTGGWAEEESLVPLIRAGQDFGGVVALTEDNLFVGERFIVDVPGSVINNQGSIHAFARSDKNFNDVPDDCELVLAHGPLVRGESVTFRAFGDAQRGEWVTFVSSATGSGAGPCFLRNFLCLDILEPFLLVGNVYVDSQGSATLTCPVPVDAPLIPVHSQAVLVRGPDGVQTLKSNVVSATIQPATSEPSPVRPADASHAPDRPL